MMTTNTVNHAFKIYVQLRWVGHQLGQKFIWVVQARIWVGHGLPGLIAGTRGLLDPGPRGPGTYWTRGLVTMNQNIMVTVRVRELGAALLPF